MRAERAERCSYTNEIYKEKNEEPRKKKKSNSTDIQYYMTGLVEFNKFVFLLLLLLSMDVPKHILCNTHNLTRRHDVIMGASGIRFNIQKNG